MGNERAGRIAAVDAKLINRARDGDQRAYEELASAYAPLLSAAVRGYTCDGSFTGEDIEDMRQEAAIAFYRAIQTYDTGSTGVSFGLYAKVCIRNRLISKLRERNRQGAGKAPESVPETAAEDGGETPAEPDCDPESILISRESITAINDLIKSVLSEYETEVFRRYMQGLSPADIAKKLGKDEKSVENAVFRIRSKLRKTSALREFL